MRRRTVASLAIFCLSTLLAASAQSEKETDPMNPTHARAKTKITVRSSEAKPYETTSPTLVEIHISERVLGEIDGESSVRALHVQRDDKFASMVSMQRFAGKLSGRHGTFVLQGKETVENGKIKATWFVIPGSGTGDLSGLRGKGGFKRYFGKGSDGWFERGAL